MKSQGHYGPAQFPQNFFMNHKTFLEVTDLGGPTRFPKNFYMNTKFTKVF